MFVVRQIDFILLQFQILINMSTAKKDYKRVTTKSLIDMKANGEKISMLTAYDYTMAKIVDSSGVDVILVGDSASNVMAGHETTLPITLDQMIYHAQSVIRGVKRSLVVVDMPFGSYQSNSDVALASAIRIMKESGAHALKLEGGAEIVDSIKKIVSAGIPVMGHLGLTPQSIYKFGTYTVRAKEHEEAEKLKRSFVQQSSEEDMIVLAKRQFEKKCFTTAQIKSLGRLFLSDATRFQFFKAAYPYIYDIDQASSLQQQLADTYYISLFQSLLKK